MLKNIRLRRGKFRGDVLDRDSDNFLSNVVHAIHNSEKNVFRESCRKECTIQTIFEMKCSSKIYISHSTTVPVCGSGSGSSISRESGSFRIRFCIQGFDDQKLQKIQLPNFFYLFLIKNFILLISRPPFKEKEKPSALKREHPAL